MLSCLWDDAYKTPMLLIGKSSPCGGNGLYLSLSEWSFTICLTRCNCELFYCVACVRACTLVVYLVFRQSFISDVCQN